MINNYQLFNSSYTTISSDDDLIDQNPLHFELPMPELWNTALPVIDEISESFSKRNANDGHEASLSSSKRIRPATPSLEPLEQKVDEIVQPALLEVEKQPARRSRKKAFTPAEDERIVQGKRDHESYRTVAKELNLSFQQVKFRWYNHLSKLHPELAKKPIEHPIAPLFTPGEEETLLEQVTKRRSWGQIAKILKRPSKQIEDHWNHVLSKKHPGIEYEPITPRSNTLFTDEIDNRIATLIDSGLSYDAIGKELGYEGHQIRHRWNRPLRDKYPGVVYKHTQIRDSNPFNIPEPAPVEQPVLITSEIPPHILYHMQLQQAAYLNGSIPMYPIYYWKI